MENKPHLITKHETFFKGKDGNNKINLGVLFVHSFISCPLGIRFLIR